MKSLKNMPESLETMTDSVRLWSLGRCFDLFVDKHKRAFSLVEKCGPILKFRDIPDWWREDLLLFSYFAFAGKNMKSQCRNHLFFSLNFFKP